MAIINYLDVKDVVFETEKTPTHQSYLESGYIYAPYIPLYTTPFTLPKFPFTCQWSCITGLKLKPKRRGLSRWRIFRYKIDFNLTLLKLRLYRKGEINKDRYRNCVIKGGGI